MRFRCFVASVALVATASHADAAAPVRFEFSGTVTFATPVIFADLGVVPGTTIEGYYEFDPETPRDPPLTFGSYGDPFTDVSYGSKATQRTGRSAGAVTTSG